jgi:hypothetical protein
MALLRNAHNFYAYNKDSSFMAYKTAQISR